MCSSDLCDFYFVCVFGLILFLLVANGAVQVALLGLEDADDIGEGILGALLASGIPGERDGDADTNDTRLEEDVADGNVSERLGSLTRLLEVTVRELDGLGTLGAALTRDDDLATLGLRLHDEADDTISSAADGEALEELEPEIGRAHL